VRDCFAGNFAEDRWILNDKPNDSYDIVDIYDAFVRWDKLSETAEAKRAALEQEYVEAKTSVCARGNVNVKKYSGDEALNLLTDCHCDLRLDYGSHDISPIKLECNQRGAWVPERTQSYDDIFDIHKALLKSQATQALNVILFFSFLCGRSGWRDIWHVLLHGDRV